jgi:hypothetical protein
MVLINFIESSIVQFITLIFSWYSDCDGGGEISYGKEMAQLISEDITTHLFIVALFHAWHSHVNKLY